MFGANIKFGRGCEIRITGLRASFLPAVPARPQSGGPAAAGCAGYDPRSAVKRWASASHLRISCAN